MAQCCNDCFKVCEPLNACPTAFYIQVPNDYTEPEILLNITKPGVNVRIQQLLTIDLDGFIDADLTAMPEGFLNPWGGSYTLSFTNSATLQPVTFTAGDGKQYTDICMSFAQTYINKDDNLVILNIFNDNQPILYP